MKPDGIKILGQHRVSPWERLCKLQRTTAKFARRCGQPKGVYRFASYQECAEWTKQRIKN
jgi:hypothetical protein